MSSLTISESYEPVYRSSFDQHMFSTQSVINHVSETNSMNAVINTISTSTDHLEPFDNIQQRVQSITSISHTDKTQLLNLLSEYHSIFSNRPGCNRLYTCSFNVVKDEPFKVHPYPIPFAQRPAVEQELNRMLEWGVIERSSAPYASPIICVKKSDGSVRLCLDARRINKIIVPTRDASPPLDEILARFHGSHFAFKLTPQK